MLPFLFYYLWLNWENISTYTCDFHTYECFKYITTVCFPMTVKFVLNCVSSFSTDGFFEYWESRCLCGSHQATLTYFYLERFYLLEWLFLYQKARMRTSWGENSSRTRISVDLPTDVKRGRRSKRIIGIEINIKLLWEKCLAVY